MYTRLLIQAFIVLLATPAAIAAFNPFSFRNNHPKATATSQSALIFPLSGNVYPLGHYYVTMKIGTPPKSFFLDMDTGSGLTWVQCDAPCRQCTPAPNGLYKPIGNTVPCRDPICASLLGLGHHDCQEDQCHYEVKYADNGSSLGVLLSDSFSLGFKNGSMTAPRLAFGCGYDQEVGTPHNVPYTDGVLGLGVGKSSILTQLSEKGVTRNVIGHCLSGKGGGFLFIGDDQFLPHTGIVWKRTSVQLQHYSLGPADLNFGGSATNIKGLPIVFDSGSTFTYFNSKPYLSLLSLIKGSLNVKELKDDAEDESLPVCWKGAKPFTSIHDVVKYFKPLALSFTDVRFDIPPESYLIITKKGRVCLGILNGSEVGLGNINVIGDISLQDKLVIYDNEGHRIGWGRVDCNKLANL